MIASARVHPDRWQTPLGLAAVLALCVLVYWPGLQGGFLFDDWSNLPLLGMYGAIDSLENLVLYLLSGFSGPTGRPLSHLSFLLDARDWPASPVSFKRTNLIIHLLNGVALFGLLRQLTLALGVRSGTAGKVALLAAGIWLLHPYWVSTTLYVVQRMTQLSGLFVLLGLWLYAWGRMHCAPRLSVRLGSVMLFSIAGCSVLAVLAKENGALLPLLAIVLELTVLDAHDHRHHRAPSRTFRIARWMVLGLPTLFILLYMAREIPPLLAGDPGVREFTPGQRLLTQGRVLWDYLFNIVLPRPSSGSLFNDDIAISTSLLQPWNTGLAWAGWIALATWAFINRLRHPAWALAILFFLTGHLLESSLLPLELYFEHRNYLPAAMIGLPPALWLARTRTPRLPASGRRQVALGLVSILAFLTLMRTDLWGRPFPQAMNWAQEHPNSPRALHYLASFWRTTGNLDEVLRLNRRARELDPSGLPLLIEAATLNCRRGLDPSIEIATLLAALDRRTYPSAVATAQVAQFLDHLLDGRCAAVDTRATLELIAGLEQTGQAQTTPSFLIMLTQREGRGWLMLREPERAMAVFVAFRARVPDEGPHLSNVAMLASFGHYEHALALLDRTPAPTDRAAGLSIAALKTFYMDEIGYYPREKRHLRETLLADIASSRSRPSASNPNKPPATHE